MTTTLPNRRDDEVRRLLDTPHPAVPVDLPARAMLRGRRTLHRRRMIRLMVWTMLLTAVVAGVVVAVLMWPDTATSSGVSGPRDSWWATGG